MSPLPARPPTLMPARSTPRQDDASSLGDRRLYRRYPTGLAAELLIAEETLECRIIDISLGGAAVELDPGRDLPPSSAAYLRSPEIAAGFPMPVTIMRLTDQRANLAFSADEEAEHQLTMYLLDSPTTQESLLETA
jgi:hypothetical protein